MSPKAPSYYLCYTTWRVILPATLLAAAVLRVSCISLVYLCLLLVLPVIQTPRASFVASSFSRLNVAVILASFLAVFAQAVFQLFLVIDAEKRSVDYGHGLVNCSLNETILRHIGLQRLDFGDPLNAARLVLPDVLLFVVATTSYFVSRCTARQWAHGATAPTIVSDADALRSQRAFKPGSAAMARLAADAVDFLAFSLIGLCAALVPSATSALYLAAFLGAAVWWSSACQSSPGSVMAVKAILAAYMALHILLLYIAQAQWVATQLAADAEYYVRLFGIAPLVTSDCNAVWAIHIVPHGWTYFANPVALVVTYFVLVTQIRHRIEKLAQRQTPVAADHEDHDDVGWHTRRRGRARSLERQVLISDRASPPPPCNDENLVDDIYAPYNTFGSPASQSAADASHHESHAVVVRSQHGGSTHHHGTSSDIRDSPDGAHDRGRRGALLLAAVLYVKESSYLLMFVSLMAWSVLYRSWTAFALLCLACITWLLPDSRRAALVVSPLVTAYAIVLIIVQYISGVNYADNALSEGLFFNYTDDLNDAGIQKENIPGEALLIKVCLAGTYWLTMRQFVTERRLLRHATDGPSERRSSFSSWTHSSAQIREFGYWMTKMFGGLWIFAFSILFLLMSIQEAYIYKMIYMICFLFYVLAFQISFSFWKAVLRPFLWIVVIYSIVVVVTVYTLSFDKVLHLLINVSKVNRTIIQDMGFDGSGSDSVAGALLNRLIVPAVFLVVIMLQLHVFHDAFLRTVSTDASDSQTASDIHDRAAARSSTLLALMGDSSAEHHDGSQKDGCCAGFGGFVLRGLKKMWPPMVSLINSCLVFVDCHMTKAIAFIVVYLALKEPSALNFVLLLVVCILMHTARTAKMMVVICQLWVGLIILAKMGFKLQTAPQTFFVKNCTGNLTDSVAWFGLDKMGALPGYLSGEIGIIVALCIYAVVRTRQELHFSTRTGEQPPAGQVFPDISLEAAEGSLCKLVQFMLNYGFQTLGLEITFATSVVVVASRQDGMALLYACLLAVMLLLAACSRRACARAWPVYLIVLIVLLPAQYLAVIGLPPALCTGYPWNISNPALQTWLFLPSSSQLLAQPSAELMLGDFFQLLMVSLQMHVFARELRARHLSVLHAAEVETSSCSGAVTCDAEMHDFIDTRRNFVDVLKNIVFVYWFLGTLVIMFVTGTANINLFCFGYVATSFYFLWYGDDFLQKKRSVRLKSWHLAMAYNFLVILVKLIMQLIGCAFPNILNCVVVQLFSITCLSTRHLNNINKSCEVAPPPSAASFTWDVICFIALLIQRRIFISRFFALTVIEIKTENRLASSGAKLINQLLASRRKKRKEEEERNLEALQKKVERIQLRQLRLQQRTAYEFDEHYKVIRSGGAYMFEDDSDDDELTSTTDGNTVSTDDAGENTDLINVVDPLTLMAIAVNQGVKTSLATAAEMRAHPNQDSRHTGGPDVPSASPQSEGGDGAAGDDSGPQAAVADAEPGASHATDATCEGGQAPNDLNGVHVHVKDASWETTKDVARLSKTLCESIADYFTVKLLSISKDYRIVAKQLQQERKKVKLDLKKSSERPATQSTTNLSTQPLVDLEASAREGRGLISSQAASAGTNHAEELPSDPSSPTKLEQELAAEDRLLEGQAGGGPDGSSGDGSLARSSRLYRLISVFCVAITSRTELLCYFAMILNHLCSGSVLTMPLPIAAFLWGQLSIPRPAKTFWVAVLTYLMAVILIKYICQFPFITWDDTLNAGVFNFPKIFGLMRSPDYAAYDIAVLLCVFLHRSALRKYGLWKSASELQFDLARAKSMVRTRAPVAGALPQQVGGAATFVDSSSSAELSNQQSSVDDSKTEDHVADDMPPNTAGQETAPTAQPAATSYWQNFRANLSGWVDGLVGRDHNASLDVYPYIFFCDFVNFVIVVFFYWSFGPTAGNVANYLKDNRIPVPFLIQLLVQFMLIVVDRALYLRRNAFGKFVFQVVLVLFVHAWMFFLLPWITQLPFTANKPAQVWYFTKCIYFWLSAYQIRSGYPINTIAGSFFRKHNYLSWTLLAAARAIPFLMELRIAMDWIWTESSLAIGHWFTMEDVYANVFSMKCLRNMEEKYPTPRGHNRGAASKYLWGGFVLFGLAFIVWFPLLLFSFANAVYSPNPPVECTFTLTIGGYQPLFTAVAQDEGVASITSQDYYQKLAAPFKNSKDATSYLEVYDDRDVRVIRFRGNSSAIWAISPPDRESLSRDVCSNISLSVTVHVTLTRGAADGLVARIIKGEFSRQLDPNVRGRLCTQLNDRSVNQTDTIIESVFPRFITVPASGTPAASPLNILAAQSELPSGVIPFSNVSLTFYSTRAPLSSGWWSVQESTSHPDPLNTSAVLLNASLQDVAIVAFSNRVAPASFSFLTGYGVIGLYVSIVFVIGRFLRIFTSGQLRSIMFDELPNVDKILKLCHNIYFARQLKKFRLEEDLFAKLIYLYRSPDVLLRWTKVKVT